MPNLPSKVYVVIRYFYPADESRWINLEFRGRIGFNQQVLLDAYREIKTATPNMSGMTVTTIRGQKTYAPILLP